MATGRREKARKPITIAIKGDATVGAATRLKATLQQALQSASAVTVSLENITGVDVTFLQLLCSAHRTAAEAGATLTIKGTDREPVTSLLRQAGFLRHIGCHESTRRSCLWLDPSLRKGSTGR